MAVKSDKRKYKPGIDLRATSVILADRDGRLMNVKLDKDDAVTTELRLRVEDSMADITVTPAAPGGNGKDSGTGSDKWDKRLAVAFLVLGGAALAAWAADAFL